MLRVALPPAEINRGFFANLLKMCNKLTRIWSLQEKCSSEEQAKRVPSIPVGIG